MLGCKTRRAKDASLGPQETNDPFFLNYNWCLNPILSVGELVKRMEEEVERRPGLEFAWQREQSRINIYLFASAISCALDDYLARRPWRLTPIGNLFPEFKWLVGIADRLVNFPSTLRAFFVLGPIRKWKVEWDGFVERACDLLLTGADGSVEDLSEMQVLFDRIRSMKKTFDILDERMKLNEGFRCQDLTHHDVVTLAQRYLSSVQDKRGRFVIIGARTAGSYIAPLVKVFLQRNGIRNVSWMTVRPKFGPFGREKRRMRRMLRPDVYAILVDDYSNTGDTFRTLEADAISCGVPARNITMLAPIHPAKSQGDIRANMETNLIVLEIGDLFIGHMLEPETAGTLLKGLLSCDGVADVTLSESRSTKVLNESLWSHYPDSFQVRLKRVYDVSIRRKNGFVEKRRVLAKSVGLGWLGYHAFLVGKELTGYVPEIIGLRDGILFMDWIEGVHLSSGDLSGQALDRLGTYLAYRTKKLALHEDPRSDPPFLSWGWLEILSIFRRVYGNLPGYLKHEVLLKRLQRSIDSSPTLIDGRMRPAEWLSADGRLFKTDFEQHNFGPPERDVVDPAYDIAAASSEFRMTEEQEGKLVAEYSIKSGDRATLSERVFLYKLLYGVSEARRAHRGVLSSRKASARLEYNDRFVRSWNFLVFTMNKLCAGLMRMPKDPPDPSALFFMDVDGTFDSETLGFPHTTPSGLSALDRLRLGNYSIIPNTGRSAEHVKNYCRNYGFSAGIGEYGGVLIDSTRDLEIPLVSEESLKELDRCRRALSGLNGVYLDPSYRYAVRAYRYTFSGTCGLKREEAENVIEEYGLRNLKIILRGADTYFVASDSDKGKAIDQYRSYSGFAGGITVAVGDSDEDISMFRKVVRSYAPSNCSEEIKKMARQDKCGVVQGPVQRGLLQIAELETGGQGGNLKQSLIAPENDSLTNLVVELLSISEAPRYKRLLSLLDLKGLGFGFSRQ